MVRDQHCGEKRANWVKSGGAGKAREDNRLAWQFRRTSYDENKNRRSNQMAVQYVNDKKMYFLHTLHITLNQMWLEKFVYDNV